MSADQSEPEATVHPQVTMENSRALWRTLAGVPRRPEPDIATPAAVSNQSSASTLKASRSAASRQFTVLLRSVLGVGIKRLCTRPGASRRLDHHVEERLLANLGTART